MTAEQLLALEDAIPILQAEEAIRERGSELTAESLGRLVERATGSREAGERAAARRALELARKEQQAGGVR